MKEKAAPPVQNVTPLVKWKMMVAILQRYRNSAITVVAIRILDHFNATTRRCDPSFATLARGAGVSRATAMRAVRQLTNDGWLIVTRRKSTTKANENISNSFAFDWARASTTHETTPGDTDDTTLVSAVHDGGDTDGATPSSTGDTQNCESKTGNETGESKLGPGQTEFSGSSSSDRLPGINYKTITGAETLPAGMVHRPHDDKGAWNHIARSAFGFLNYQRGDRPNGEYPDIFVMDRLPPEALAEAMKRCKAGTLSHADVAAAMIALNIPHKSSNEEQNDAPRYCDGCTFQPAPIWKAGESPADRRHH